MKILTVTALFFFLPLRTPAADPPPKPALEVLVLGSGGPRPFGRAGSSFIVMVDGTPRILVDAGPGAFVRIGEMQIDLEKVDTVLLTHLHIDHSGDLAAFFNARALTSDGPITYRIFGPDGAGLFPKTSRFVDLLVGEGGAFAYQKTFGAEETFSVHDLAINLDSARSKILDEAGLVVEEITPVLLDRLRAGTIDVAILALPIRGHEFEILPLLTERLFVALPPKHTLAGRRALSLKDLRAEPFLLLRDGHCFRDTAVAACDRVRLNPQIIFESGQFSSLLSMVGAGMGVSIVPQMAVEKSGRCRYVRIADDSATRTIAALVLRGRSLTRTHLGFLAHLRVSSDARTAHG